MTCAPIIRENLGTKGRPCEDIEGNCLSAVERGLRSLSLSLTS